MTDYDEPRILNLGDILKKSVAKAEADRAARDDMPAECSICKLVPHDTFCDSCGRLVCIKCAFDSSGSDDWKVCLLCMAKQETA